jgi:hypothetical protein
VLDAPSADQQVDGFADTDALPAQGTEIAGSYDRNRVTGYCTILRPQCSKACMGQDMPPLRQGVDHLSLALDA